MWYLATVCCSRFVPDKYHYQSKNFNYEKDFKI